MSKTRKVHSIFTLTNFQIYTDEQHALSGGNTQRHLYNTLEDFLLQCYGQPSQLEAHTQEPTEKDAEEADD